MLIIITLSLFTTAQANAEILFEGYSKIMLSDTHVGYIVQRYEFNSKSNEFSTAYYLKTNDLGGNITESLKARATSSLKPVSFQFTELTAQGARTIDATFKNDNMTAIITKAGKKETIASKIPKDTYLSSFLVYLFLQGKKGIQAGANYGYSAIAEEDAKVYSGEANILSAEIISGINTFKVKNTFKGSPFESNVTHKGEIISTRAPLQKISTQLVATMEEATKGMSIVPGHLAPLFGSVPKGIANVISRGASSTTIAPSPGEDRSPNTESAASSATPPTPKLINNSMTPPSTKIDNSPAKKE
jgi:hypothetical protein